MSGIGAKLSRHVLGIKFMKKTKAEVDMKKEREYTKTEGQVLKTEAGTSCGIVAEKPPKTKVAMYPIPTSDQVKDMSTVLSLIILGDRIAWNQVERTDKATGKSKNATVTVRSWQQVNYLFKPRMHFLQLLKEMEAVAKQIPKCDICLIEEYPSTVPTPYMFNFHLHLAQAKSLLVGIMSAQSNPPIIVSIKTIAVARLFNTYVGSEKVSGQHIVDELLMNKIVPLLSVPDEILSNYNASDVRIKESLSQAFLLNLSYWEMTKQMEIRR